MIAGKHAPSPIDTPPTNPPAMGEHETQKVQAIEVLAELYELLEMYAPQWYTEEHRRKAVSVLRRSGQI